jgi:ion channel-forming bestrophin family protein
MIIYNSKDWFKAIRHFHQSYVIRLLGRRVLIYTLFATAVTTVHMEVHQLEFNVDGAFFSILGILLSLLMVFRTNTAYDRYWEGRIQWGNLVNHSRNLAIIMDAILASEDKANRQFFARMISNFSLALKDHLRAGVQVESLYEADECTREDLIKYQHKPARLSALIMRRVEYFHKNKTISGEDILNIKIHHQGFMDICGACERIRRTPIPFSYSFFIKLFITLYVVFLPFVIVEALGWAAIPAAALGMYALVGLEMIADEIEEPFGLDCNDLPLGMFAQNIGVQVHEILQMPVPEGQSLIIDKDYLKVH